MTWLEEGASSALIGLYDSTEYICIIEYEYGAQV